jgi:hypothetical protein
MGDLIADNGQAVTATRLRRSGGRLLHCVIVFDVEEIEEWIDGGQTALCPHRGIDSVLPAIDGEPDVAFLWSMASLLALIRL